MTKRIRDAIKELKAEIKELEKDAEQVSRFGEDSDYPEQSVIFFRKQFGESGPIYTYAAVKGGGLWYLTGKVDYPIDFDELVEGWLAGAKEVCYVTEMEVL